MNKAPIHTDTKLLPMQEFENKTNEANVKVVFGLQPHHIKRIEEERERWGNIKLNSIDEKVDMVFSTHFWDALGKEFAWQPFTLALYYFEYLKDTSEAAKAYWLSKLGGDGILKKYQTYIDNVRWHIRTNQPTGEALETCNKQIQCYVEIVNDLSVMHEYAATVAGKQEKGG